MLLQYSDSVKVYVNCVYLEEHAVGNLQVYAKNTPLKGLSKHKSINNIQQQFILEIFTSTIRNLKLQYNLQDLKLQHNLYEF